MPRGFMKGPVLYFGLLAIVVVAIAGFFMPEAGLKNIHQWSMEAFSPVYRSLGWMQDQKDAAAGRMLATTQAVEEIRKLREENARLGAENLLLRGHEAENARLKEMLGFKKDAPYRLLAARVIERDPSSWWNAVMINRGYEDDPGLAQDQPVVSARGVVGKTGTVGRYTTRVILLIDENCKISAASESSRSRGIVQGSTSINGGQPHCRFTFISREAELTVGERVFTTGLGGTFPPNLLIGTVMEAPPLSADRNFGLYREGVVQPTTDLNDLQEVFVILGLP